MPQGKQQTPFTVELLRTNRQRGRGLAPAAAAGDAASIRQELAWLRDSINETKKEIAVIRHSGAESDPILTATDEFDAIIEATEVTTHTILERVEQIDELAQRVRHSTSEEHTADLLEEVGELIVIIFGACNFQDITGQRITKVVNTMKFIEDHVNAMVEIWGTESFEETEVPDDVEPELHGPQTDDGGVSRDDIDKFFD